MISILWGTKCWLFNKIELQHSSISNRNGGVSCKKWHTPILTNVWSQMLCGGQEDAISSHQWQIVKGKVSHAVMSLIILTLTVRYQYKPRVQPTRLLLQQAIKCDQNQIISNIIIMLDMNYIIIAKYTVNEHTLFFVSLIHIVRTIRFF